MRACKYGMLKHSYRGRVCKRKPRVKRVIKFRNCKYGMLKRPVGGRYCKRGKPHRRSGREGPLRKSGWF